MQQTFTWIAWLIWKRIAVTSITFLRILHRPNLASAILRGCELLEGDEGPVNFHAISFPGLGNDWL
jgi:hypothetical protein